MLFTNISSSRALEPMVHSTIGLNRETAARHLSPKGVIDVNVSYLLMVSALQPMGGRRSAHMLSTGVMFWLPPPP